MHYNSKWKGRVKNNTTTGGLENREYTWEKVMYNTCTCIVVYCLYAAYLAVQSHVCSTTMDMY